MMERMDVVMPKPGKDGKSYFVRVGSAWPTKNGGWSLSLDALPTPTLGDKGQLETRLLLMPPLDKSGSGPSRSSAVRSGGSSGPDDFPF